VREFLRNAFALDDGKPCAPSDDERAILERLVDEVVRRRLAAPALAFLEMSRPLNVVGAAVIHFFTPIAAVLTNPVHLRRFADFLERRGSVDYLCRMIERAEEMRRNGCCEGLEPLETPVEPAAGQTSSQATSTPAEQRGQEACPTGDAANPTARDPQGPSAHRRLDAE
jgi:hypothetical protein